MASVKRLSSSFTPDIPTAAALVHVCTEEKLATFLEGGLWCARLDQFNDPLEASVPVHNRLDLLAKHPPVDAAWIRKQYDDTARCTYASCWSTSGGGVPAHMWASFGKCGNRVAIETTPDHLTKALAPIPVNGNGPVYLSAIRYVEHAVDDVPPYNTLETCFVVRRGYHEEQEARLLVHTRGTAASDHLGGLIGPKGPVLVKQAGLGLVGGHLDGKAVVLPADPRILIQRVTIDKFMPRRRLARILLKLARRGLLCRVRFR